MQHVELHNHDHYSILDGAATPEDYMNRAVELGMTHIAQTNHGTTSGHREFQREAKKAGIKPILGIEAYITNDRFDRRTAAKRNDGTSTYNHITLLAKNEVGLKNIEAMNKVAWEEGYYYKPRMDFELLEAHNEGVIALSGCMSGMVAKKFLNGMPAQSRSDAVFFKELFGDDFYMEVMESNSDELNGYLISLAKDLNVKPVVTSDCHMARKEDLVLAEAMLILSTGAKFDTKADVSLTKNMNALDAFNHLYPDRQMSFQKFELWLHSYQEHVDNLAKQGIGPEAVSNTMLIADKIGDYPYYEKLDTLPEYETGGKESITVLRDLIETSLVDKGLDNPTNRERINMEIDTIESLGLADYFLIEKDIMDFAADNDVLTGFGRGSAVSYLSNYLLGITKIEPTPYNLLPERFISKDRDDPADVDSDFDIEGRYKVKEYVKRKYAHVSNIATYGYYKDKSAIKAAAKVFKANFRETTLLLKNFETIEAFESAPETADYRSKYPNLMRLAKQLNGKIQNTGIHAGGIILSKNPIEDNVPLQSAKDPSDNSKDRVAVAALDMKELADMGYVKYDLLGLRTLSIVQDTLKLIKSRHGVDIDIYNLPLEDKNIYNMISSGHTAGLFQAEASASTKIILKMGGVANFKELIASNALVRPGAANSTVGETYMRGKDGDYEYIHADAKWFTEETYSAILYQEQQLLLCQEIAGMSPKDANKVRKAVSKKVLEDLVIWKPAFIEGASKKVGEEKAEKIWLDLEASADYAFAKSHAVAYSMLTYLTGYLKYYYPLEFFTSAISRMKTANKDDRMKMLRYMMEAKRLGIRILLPHINESGPEIGIGKDAAGDHIRLGLSNIKGIGVKTAQPILSGAPWTNYAQLMEAMQKEGSGIRSNTIAALNKVGAAAFYDNPRTGEERDNFFTYLSLPALNAEAVSPKVHSNFDSLVDHEDESVSVFMGIVAGETRKNGWRRLDIVDEQASVSAFVSPEAPIVVGEVYIFLLAGNSVARYVHLNELESSGPFLKFLEADSFPEVPEGAFKVVGFNSRTTKAGKKMADVVLADAEKSLVSALVFPMQFIAAYSKMREGSIVKVNLKETKEGTPFVDGVDYL